MSNELSDAFAKLEADCDEAVKSFPPEDVDLAKLRAFTNHQIAMVLRGVAAGLREIGNRANPRILDEAARRLEE